MSHPIAPSVLDGLSLEKAAGQVTVTCPEKLYTPERARQVAEEYQLPLEIGDGLWSVSFPLAAEVAYPAAARRFFARLNRYPAPCQASCADYQEPIDPEISCIVVLNENLPFVRDQLIPSLLANSSGHTIEIVVVWNGGVDPAGALGEVRTVASAWGAVASAYNAGVAVSRAPLLAIFHDDCVVDDEAWIPRALRYLEGEASAVSPELRQLDRVGESPVPALPILKNVPLLIRRADFERVGGYDENHYIGYEDLDFTLGLLSGRMKIAHADLRVRHFHGMSSTLKYSRRPDLAELYALLAVPRAAVAEFFVEIMNSGPREVVEHLQLIKDVQLLRVLEKHREFLANFGADTFERARLLLIRAIQARDPGAVHANRKALECLDRLVVHALVSGQA
jgi:hypothetical protein